MRVTEGKRFSYFTDYRRDTRVGSGVVLPTECIESPTGRRAPGYFSCDDDRGYPTSHIEGHEYQDPTIVPRTTINYAPIVTVTGSGDLCRSQTWLR